MEAKDQCDGAITLDIDLQDDLNAIREMLEAHRKGYDIVYGVKKCRKADPFMKRLSAMAFYGLQNSMGIKCIYNHADFRFMSRKALYELSLYNERNLYLRGIIPMLGLPSTKVSDNIKDRIGGKSKYTFSRMMRLAADGITSFSIKPIHFIIVIGSVFIAVSFIIAIYVVASLILDLAMHGWASLMLSIWFVGGVIMISLGIIGIYIGKIYTEVKQRPLYNIKEKLL